MSKNNTNVPKIRFPGFTDPWEQRKLGNEAIEIVAGGDIDRNRIVDSGKYPVLANALTNDGIVGYYEKDFRIKAPAVTVTGRGDIGHAKARNIDFTPVVRLLSIKTKHDVDFLEHAINNHNVLVESTGVPQLTVPQLSKYEIYFPKTDIEEKAIGVFFKTLDHLITLHQRKLNHLQDKKKGLLQKMFPKSGQCFPELRFPGFTDPWEQRKLGEIAKRVTCKNTKLESTLPLTISAQYGLVDQISFFNKRVASRDIRGYYLLRKGEFAYNKSYSEGYPLGAVKRLERYENGVLSTLYICFKLLDVNSNFLISYYDTKSWYKEVAQRATEGARNHGLLNISADDFFDTKLIIPKSKEEQATIGAFFKNLDHLITLHQRKLSHLQEQKKALLQQMFV
mgnify:CR=1 FL=1